MGIMPHQHSMCQIVPKIQIKCKFNRKQVLEMHETHAGRNVNCLSLLVALYDVQEQPGLSRKLTKGYNKQGVCNGPILIPSSACAYEVKQCLPASEKQRLCYDKFNTTVFILSVQMMADTIFQVYLSVYCHFICPLT